MAGSLCTSVPLKLSITSLNVLFFLVLNMDIWELNVNEFQFTMFERRHKTTTTVSHFFLHDRDTMYFSLSYASQHPISGHYLPASETPFGWRFACGPIVARFYVHTRMELFISHEHTCNSTIELSLEFFMIIGSRYKNTCLGFANLLSYRD